MIENELNKAEELAQNTEDVQENDLTEVTKAEEVVEKADAIEEKTEEVESKVEEVVEKADVIEEKTEEVESKVKEVVEKAEEVEEKVAEKVEVTEEKTKPKEKKKAPKKTSEKEVKTLYASVESDKDFDWKSYGNSNDIYSMDQREDFIKQYDETLSTVAENEVVEGTVILMNKREVVINIGYKSEGVVSLNEFRYNPELKVGDKVEVYVESQEDKKGQMILSHKKARALKSWDRVNEALEKDEIIKGYIKCRTKGGMIVDVFGIEAFLPGSQIDVKPIRDYDVLCWQNNGIQSG